MSGVNVPPWKAMTAPATPAMAPAISQVSATTRGMLMPVTLASSRLSATARCDLPNVV